ncbi:O-antigen ligase family protein [Hymenobacter sp. ASUV-10]|uniref:O-antigen ligase family protein n=1 Tax=Hymenobacter aranciens TaxID=3063996 RepID=A0ABT9BBJ4_9BACT|nr:O-antigen ligase family protein [Hymenobacter sp. ASUV-10]MDO7875640.1 O-antigen ligase family protein [Hymenobacter sp. ASUV-10]
MSSLWQRLRRLEAEQRFFIVFVTLLLLGGAGAVLRHDLSLLLPGVLLAGGAIAFLEWRILYYLLFFSLPFSLEIGLPGGLSMDVPSEPLMLVLMACVGLMLLLGKGRLPQREWLHPLMIVLALMLLWAAVDTLFSVDITKSVKYLLAKTWYIMPFLLGTLLLVRRPAQVWQLVAVYVTSTCLGVLYVVSRHAGRGFNFDEINWSLKPFFHNHVIYATLLATLIPYVLYAYRATPNKVVRLAWIVALLVLLFGLFTSYTRASMLSLPIIAIYYGVLRLRLTKALLLSAGLAAGSAATYFMHNDRYMLYAPEFEKVIFNGKNFSRHLEATYNMQDVSGMERVYRWVAAARMIADKPLVGSGPSTFYPEYKNYTVRSFRTYVSNNPEKSTSHNYFLLQLAEQGIPGFVLFVVLVAFTLLTAERLYHQTARHPALRRVVLAVTLSLVVILFHLLLNELIEVDKIGALFFVGLALLIRLESWVIEANQLTNKE